MAGADHSIMDQRISDGSSRTGLPGMGDDSGASYYAAERRIQRFCQRQQRARWFVSQKRRTYRNR